MKGRCIVFHFCDSIHITVPSTTRIEPTTNKNGLRTCSPRRYPVKAVTTMLVNCREEQPDSSQASQAAKRIGRSQLIESKNKRKSFRDHAHRTHPTSSSFGPMLLFRSNGFVQPQSKQTLKILAHCVAVRSKKEKDDKKGAKPA